MTASIIPPTCAGRTCLNWSADGSLSEQDELMKRLCATDPTLVKSEACIARLDAELNKIYKK